MKKKLLFLVLSVLTLGAWADTYTPVEYIATTTAMKDGDSNADVPYINTGYVHKANTKIEMECVITAEQKNWEALFGTRNGDGDTKNGAFVFFWRTNGSNVGCYNRGDGEKAGSNSIPKDVRIKVLANPGSVTIKKVSDNSNVTTISTSNASTGNSNKPIYIFDTNTTNQAGLHPDGSRTYMKLYSFKIYEGDNLVRDYVPVKRSDNKTGLYDLKNNTFISSATSKDFEAGYTWNGTDDAILPSIKYGGSYVAYTWTKVSTEDYGNGEANNSHFNTIVGIPGDDSNGKKWYDVDYLMPTTSSIEWQLGNSVLPSNWATGNKYGDVYVRRNFIIASGTSLPSTIYMPTPHDDAPCEYYINGELVWSRTGTEPSVVGWHEDEVVRLTDAQKTLIKTDGTVNVFAFHVHQNWGGRYADGGLYGDAGTDGTPSKKFTDNANRRYLEETIALAESEGVDASIIDYGKEKQNFLQDASVALEKLRIARKRHNAEKVTEEFVGTAPADGLECYLYNVGEKKFLCGGNNLGTHASLGFAAHFVTLSQVEGGYKIQTHLPNGTEGTNDFLGENGYVDVTTGAVWQFVKIDGNYNIKLASDNTRLLGYESPTVNQVSTNCKTAAGATNQWKLVTKAERDALLVNATPDNPVDATYYIDNPGFDQRWSISNWTLSDMAVNNRGQEKSDFVVSGWNESGDGNTAEDFKIEQVITGLMPGLYEVGVQACYRHGGDSEDDGESYAKLFANNEETIIKGVKAEINKIPQYTTLGTDEKAIEAFQTGLYKNKVRVAVGSDGELTIGVKRDAANFTPYDWLAADNFRLTYLGGYVELDEARLDYIENNIDEIGKQYYDTGYRPNEDTKVEVKFWANTDGGNDWQAIFSGRNSGNNQSKTGISMYVHGNKVGYFVGNLGGSGDDFADLTRGEVHTAIASLGSMVLDGVEKSTGQSTWNTTTNNITLFSNPTWDHSFRGRIYYCKIYEGDELRHYFVPILKDGVPYFHCEKCNDDIAPHEGATFTYSHNSGINETANVIKLNRTLKAGRWNTFCVPFNMDKSKLGEGAEVKELSGATKNGDNYTMNFTDASTIEAGKPYMVKVASEINSIELFNESGIAVNTTGTPSVTKDGVTFTGVYANGNAPLGSFIISNNVFYNVDSTVALKAFRGYITVSSGDYVKALDFTFEDDDATAIEMVNGQSSMVNGSIYNLAGQRLSKTQKGINIVNGKKIMVK